jgi:hypothetical protein
MNFFSFLFIFLPFIIVLTGVLIHEHLFLEWNNNLQSIIFLDCWHWNLWNNLW